MNYEAVIGLEVHIELNTKTKLLCSCKNAFGYKPNTLCCPICSGMPGALPLLNKQAVLSTIKAGIALRCVISKETKFDRKNYSYPDLPKGYQVTQFNIPLCRDGYIDIGNKLIRIERIHLEEDAGKLIHDQNNTLIDLNRCGVPLIEVVSRPDIRSANEAIIYLQKLRNIIMYTGVSDCKMNEGSFRVDVNISVRKMGEEEYGIKSEIKNVNSFQFIHDAITYEIGRHIEIYKNGQLPLRETRRYDEKSKKTFSLRTKESTNEYRYLPEPDISKLTISDDLIESLKESIPMLPEERERIYKEKYNLTQFDCDTILQDVKVADYFEETTKYSNNYKACANLIISELFSLSKGDKEFSIKPERLSAIADLMVNDYINSSTAKKVLSELWKVDFDPNEYIDTNQLSQINDESILNKFIDEVFNENIKAVEDYRKGKTNAIKALTGQVMSKTKGRANPIKLQNLIDKKLGMI